MIEKIKLWLLATGLTNIAYAGGAIGAWILGYPVLAGACAGIFVYVNFNVIKKLITGAAEKL
jgi:hypothetical protein